MIAGLSLLIALAVGAVSSPEGKLDSLTWLEGHWVSEAFGGTIEEIWLPTTGDVKHGVFRLTVDGRLVFAEFLQLTVEEGEILMRFEHFRPDYSTWEGTASPMELKVTEATSNSVVFEAFNPTSPSRITYTLEDNELQATVTGVDEVLRFQRR